MSTQAPLSWVKQIEEGATVCQKIPLWGSCPLFPWEKISEGMQKKLQIDDFKLQLSECKLLDPKDFLSAFGKSPKLLFFQLSPLEGTFTWVLSSESVEHLTTSALSSEKVTGLSDPSFQEGFYKYLLLQISEEIEKSKTYPDLHIQWLDDKDLPKEPSLALDVSITLRGTSLSGRLIVSPESQSAFCAHFSQNPAPLTNSASYEKIDVPLSLEVGSCLLSQTDFASIKIGDFLLLDRCSYDPSTDKGSAILSLAEKPCFIVKIKKNGLKILDYAVYHGDTNTMDEEFISDSFEEETPLPKPEKNENEPKKIEEDTQESSSIENLEQDLEDDTPLLEDTELTKTAPPETLTSPGKIPFPVVVEVDRIKMSLEKLLQLTPGNIIQMNVHPNQGVYLTVHGKKVARGELIKIGEVLGVKILETGEIQA